MNTKRFTPRHIKIKMAKFKNKEKTLKAARENQLGTYKENAIKLSADFSTDTLKARKDWHEIFQVMKRKDLQVYSKTTPTLLQDYSIKQGCHLK